MRKMIIRILEALNWFIDYMVETWLNKVVALLLALSIVLMAIAVSSWLPLTFLVFAIVLFCAEEDVFKF